MRDATPGGLLAFTNMHPALITHNGYDLKPQVRGLPVGNDFCLPVLGKRPLPLDARTCTNSFAT